MGICCGVGRGPETCKGGLNVGEQFDPVHARGVQHPIDYGRSDEEQFAVFLVQCFRSDDQLIQDRCTKPTCP